MRDLAAALGFVVERTRVLLSVAMRRAEVVPTSASRLHPEIVLNATIVRSCCTSTSTIGLASQHWQRACTSPTRQQTVQLSLSGVYQKLDMRPYSYETLTCTRSQWLDRCACRSGSSAGELRATRRVARVPSARPTCARCASARPSPPTAAAAGGARPT